MRILTILTIASILLPYILSSRAAPFVYHKRGTGTTILAIKLSPEALVLASDSRTTIHNAIASDATIKLHDVIDPEPDELSAESQSWPTSIMSNSIEYKGSLVRSAQSATMATVAGAGTSGDVTYILDELKSECRMGIKLRDGVTPQEVLSKIKKLTLSGKKECSLIMGLTGSDSCSCQIIDSTNGSREVLHYVALGSGGPFATAYLDSVLTGSNKKKNMSTKEGVEVAVRGVLKGVECDDFSGGRVEVVVMRRGGRMDRWRFCPVLMHAQVRQVQEESDDDDDDGFEVVVKTYAERADEIRRLKKLIEDP